jgi:hypothetical protein
MPKVNIIKNAMFIVPSFIYQINHLSAKMALPSGLEARSRQGLSGNLLALAGQAATDTQVPHLNPMNVEERKWQKIPNWTLKPQR